MVKYILFLLLSVQAFAQTKPNDLYGEMDKMRVFFAGHTVLDGDKVFPKFPEATHLLSYACEDTGADKAKRVKAMVTLAIATTPFDDENSAADVLAEEYGKAEMTEAFDKALAAQPDTPERNRFTNALRQKAARFKSGSN